MVSDDTSRWRRRDCGASTVRVSTRLGEDRGASATELAIVMPVLIILVLLPMHVALWWHAKQVADLAAEEAVDTAQIADRGAADGEQVARQLLGQVGHLTNVSIEVNVNGDTVTARVSGTPRFRVIPGPWDVVGSAEGRVERFVGEQER